MPVRKRMIERRAVAFAWPYAKQLNPIDHPRHVGDTLEEQYDKFQMAIAARRALTRAKEATQCSRTP